MPASPHIKLIATDLDRTLLRDDETISPFTMDILARCVEAGYLFVVATARSLHAARPVLDLLPTHAIIHTGGAYAVVGDQTVYTAILSPADTENAVKLCNSSPYVDHVRINGEILDVTTNPAIPVGELEYGHYHRLPDDALLPALYQPSTKITVCSNSPEKVAELFKGDSRYAYMISRNTGIQGHKLAHPKATKSAALAQVATHFGLPLKEVMAFGDDMADLDMLSACGHGVAVGNATPEAKAVADAVCLPNNDDGVAKYLREFLGHL